MEVVLAPGDKLKVLLKDTDGEFVLEYGKNAVRIKADLPDTNGRKGVIYEEKFGKPTTDKAWPAEASWDAPPADKSKLIPTRNAVEAWEDYTGSSQFLVRAPKEIAVSGMPESISLYSAPANSILVLFKGRIGKHRTPTNAQSVFVKSKDRWWPQPVTEPHNAWGIGQLKKFIEQEDYGHALYHPE